MSKTVWNWIHKGVESGPFKATKHFAIITCTSESGIAFQDPKPLDVSYEQVLNFARANRSFDMPGSWQWPNARMNRLVKTAPGIWEIEIEDAYLD